MKKIFLYTILVVETLTCCQKRHIWEYQVLPETCYADAFFIQPDFKPNGYIIKVTGILNQDVMLTILGTQPISEYSKKRSVGYNHYAKLSKGKVSFSDSAELYVDDLKIILSGSDTKLHPSSESRENLGCLPLGNIKIKLDLQ